MTPNELIARLRRGDPSALETLMDRHWSRLLAYASGILGDRDAGADVVQEAFVRLWQRRQQLTLHGALSALLYRMVRHLALSAVRTTERRVAAVEQWVRADSVPEPSMHTEACELEAAVAAALDALPKRRREVFVLARFHGLSYNQIADVMDIAPQTVANHFSMALADLRTALGPFLDSFPSMRQRGQSPS